MKHMSFLSKLFGRKESLGIDLGSGSIKVVKLRENNHQWELENYGQVRLKENRQIKKVLDSPDQQIADLIKELLQKMRIKGREFFASLPVSAGFSTIITLPEMSREETAAAVMNEAEKYVPVSLDKVIIDWTVISSTSKEKEIKDDHLSIESGKDEQGSTTPQIISEHKVDKSAVNNQDNNANDHSEKNLENGQEILLVSVLKEVAERYQNIFELSGLKIIGWEEESFSLVRSLIGQDKKMCLLIDLGYSVINSLLVDNGLIKFTYSFNAQKTEEIIEKIKQVVDLAKTKYHYQVDHIILTGGRLVSSMDWQDLFGKAFNQIDFAIGDPFAKIIVSPAIKNDLRKISPIYAVAAGLAMKKEE